MAGPKIDERGFVAIGISHAKYAINTGTLFRTAHSFGASFLFTIRRRYRRQASDVTYAPMNMPLLHFDTIGQMKEHLPYAAPLVGIELDEHATSLAEFRHPRSACYLLGAEDHGLTAEEREACHFMIQIPGFRWCLNVATAGSIVLYDRVAKVARGEHVKHARGRVYEAA
jgi:tRNA G18 (ribose-2'-O)-methylase SpoU